MDDAMVKAADEYTPEQQSAVLDFRLPDWATLDAAFGRIADLYGSRDDLSATELYLALLDGRLRAGEVKVQRNGLPLRRLLESESWRQFGGIYADRDGKPRFLPVPRGIGGVVPMPIVREHFFVRCSDLDEHYPAAGQTQAKTKAKPVTKSKLLGWQVRRVVPILYDKYRATGIPLDKLEATYAKVNAVFKERKELPVGRDSVRRAIAAIKRDDA
jgi:hypothetical protein